MLKTMGLAACLIAVSGLSYAQERNPDPRRSVTVGEGFPISSPVDRSTSVHVGIVDVTPREGQIYIFCNGRFDLYREMPCDGMPIEDPRNPNNPNPPARFGR